MKNSYRKSLRAASAGVRPGSPGSKVQLPSLVLAIICFVVAPLVIAAFIFFPFVGAAKFSILYLFGFNGKASGRMDGNVLMRNGRGRGFSVPALVRNGYTTNVRSLLSSFSTGWRSLTLAQQKTWLAFKYTKSDRFALPYTITGKAAYIGLNTNGANIGSAVMTDAPAPVGALEENVDTLAAANGANTMTYNAANLDTNSKYIVFATAGLSAGIFRPGASAFRLIGLQPAPVLGAVDIASAYNAKYGHVPATGSKVFLYTVAINSNTGERSAGGEILSAIVS